MNKSKGFTIIELIVVIAIIAVLSAIVIANVTQYISKGRDAAAIANLENIMTNAAVYYDGTALGNGTYNNLYTGASPITTNALCATAGTYSGFTNPCNALINAGYTSIKMTCDTALCAAATKWCAMTTLKSPSPAQNFCVDSTGAKIQSSSITCVAGACS